MSDAKTALQQGDWGRAARLFEEEGALKQAADLHHKLLDLPNAARLYLACGDVVTALACAVGANNRALELDTLRAALAVSTSMQASAAASEMERRQRLDLAAPLWDAAGEPEHAATAYEGCGQLATAARRWLTVGNHRTAGQLLERHLEGAPEDLQARLELGTVLARFGRHDAATPLLRKAAVDPRLADTALRRLALSFAAQGHPHAAQRVLEELAAVAPDAPKDLLALGSLEEAVPTSREKSGLRVHSRYVLLAPRAASSLGDSYLAYDEFEDRRVLLTLFKPAVAQSQALRRFAGTARAANALDSPLLVPLVEFNLAAGFVVTALPAGQPLEAWIKQGGPPAPGAVVMGVADTLWQLHRRGLVHGALNLASIHATLAGGTQLTETGAGQLLTLRETESQGLQTSLATLSPEVVGGQEPGAPADQFALAALTYFLATGHWPQPSQSPRYQPPSQLGAPATLDMALERALSARPADRWPDVRVFQEHLPQALVLAHRHSLAPTPVATVARGERFEPVGPTRVLGPLVWVHLRDTVLDRDVAQASGTAEAMAFLRALADVPFGSDRVLELQEDLTRALVLCAAAPPPSNEDAWLHVARALAAVHRAGLAFGSTLEARLAQGPRLRVVDFPPAEPGDRPEQEADVGTLAQRITHALGLAPPSGIRDAASLAEWLAESRASRAAMVASQAGAQWVSTPGDALQAALAQLRLEST